MTEKAFAMLTGEQVERLVAAYPLGAGKPEDVARAAAFLLAPGSRWITGTDLAVDGGFTAQ
jgi:NAD(P)-dependent dehydrogenase (short-subunit alcohol dehydrogenase family)